MVFPKTHPSWKVNLGVEFGSAKTAKEFCFVVALGYGLLTAEVLIIFTRFSVDKEIVKSSDFMIGAGGGFRPFTCGALPVCLI